jgi:hypothetical protein
MELGMISETADLSSKISGSVLVKREPAGLSDFVSVRTNIEKTKKTIGWVSGNVLWRFPRVCGAHPRLEEAGYPNGLLSHACECCRVGREE